MVASDGAGPHFCSRVLICVCGCSFLFMAGVVVSGCSSSVGGGHRHTWETFAVPGWGHCSWGWVVVCGCHVIVCGCWVSLWGARQLFGDGRCHLWAPGCCSWVVGCCLWVACCHLWVGAFVGGRLVCRQCTSSMSGGLIVHGQ